jgi:predicted SAM-dependent methyltransferase
MSQIESNVVELGEAVRGGTRRVLNTGCGSYAPERLHAAFRNADWKEIRLDIDQRVQPDIVGSITDLSKVESASFDAIWCSHNLEHLHTYEIPTALAEFRRVLKPDGFALITTPDLESIAELIVDGRVDDTAYESPAGPITALDMLFGLSSAIARGNVYMAHRTGFTADRMGRVLIESDFPEVFVKRGQHYDLWALALMPQADKDMLLAQLRANNLDLFPDSLSA